MYIISPLMRKLGFVSFESADHWLSAWSRAVLLVYIIQIFKDKYCATSFWEFERAVKNDARGFIQADKSGVCSASAYSSKTSQWIEETIEKLDAFSSASLPPDHRNVLHNWESLLKNIQKLEQLVSKAEAAKTFRYATNEKTLLV